METIRNYLENMFLNLPNTPEVYKAKNELWQMMEDKYTELKAEGKSENEAVGIVISEFGNLDELAADLGIASFMHSPQMQPTGRPFKLRRCKSLFKGFRQTCIPHWTRCHALYHILLRTDLLRCNWWHLFSSDRSPRCDRCNRHVPSDCDRRRTVHLLWCTDQPLGISEKRTYRNGFCNNRLYPSRDGTL